MITIALLEKKRIKRNLYARALQSMEQLQLVAEAKNVTKLIDALKVTPADVVLYCWDTAEEKDIKPLQQLQKAHPTVKVLVLITSYSFDMVFQLLQLKNSGLLEENAKNNQLEKAILKLSKKGFYYEPRLLTQKRITTYHNSIKVQEERSILFQFTPKQKEIIGDLLAQKTTKEIQDKHCITESTLRKHYREIIRITKTKTIKAALIEILCAFPDKAKLWGIKCLLALCTLCNSIDGMDDNQLEEAEYKIPYKWQLAA